MKVLAFVKGSCNQGWQYVKAKGVQTAAFVGITTGAVFGVPGYQVAVAQTTVTLPDTGIDMLGYIEAMFTEFGTYFALIIGLVFAYFAIQAGIKLIKKMSSKAA